METPCEMAAPGCVTEAVYQLEIRRGDDGVGFRSPRTACEVRARRAGASAS